MSETVTLERGCKETSALKQRWSDIVANRCNIQNKKEQSLIQNIPAVIT
jgi:hypothetical protein